MKKNLVDMTDMSSREKRGVNWEDGRKHRKIIAGILLRVSKIYRKLPSFIYKNKNFYIPKQKKNQNSFTFKRKKANISQHSY